MMLALAATGLCATGLLTGCGHAPAPAPDAENADATPINVTVAAVRIGRTEITQMARGNLVPEQGGTAKVAAAAAGRLTEILVREGDLVRRGQLLARVDNRAGAAGTASSRAALQSSLADQRQAELDLRAAQVAQNNTVRGAQLELQSARSESEGAVRQADIAARAAVSDLRKARVAAQATDAESGRRQAALALQAAKSEREASLKAARNSLQVAQTNLVKLRAGARPQEITAAEAAVKSAQATRDRAATEVERVQYLVDKGIKAKRDLDDANTALNVAEGALQAARDQLSLVRAGTRTEDMQAAALQVSAAQDALDAAQESGDAKVAQAVAALDLANAALKQSRAQRPEDLKSAVLKVAAAQDALKQARMSGETRIQQAEAALRAATDGQLQLAAKAQESRSKAALAQGKRADLTGALLASSATELRAPLAGTVTKRNLNPGDMADPATPVLEITDLRRLNLNANLPTGLPMGQFGALRRGVAVRVTDADDPSHTTMGYVASVGQVDPGTNLLNVRVAVPNEKGQWKLGAFVTAEIVLAVHEHALLVPKTALVNRDGRPAVLLAGADGKAHQKFVVTGAERQGTVEIKSGIAPGERVIETGGYQLEDGAAILVSQAPAAPATATSTAAGP